MDNILLKRVLQDQLIKYCNQNTNNPFCELVSLLIVLLTPIIILGIAFLGIYLIWAIFKSKANTKDKLSGFFLGVCMIIFSIFLFTFDTIYLYIGLGFMGLALYLGRDKKDVKKDNQIK